MYNSFGLEECMAKDVKKRNATKCLANVRHVTRLLKPNTSKTTTITEKKSGKNEMNFSIFTFNNDHAACLICSMAIRCYARIFTRIAWLTIDNFHCNDTIWMCHRIFVFAELSFIFVPFNGWCWFATQTTQQFACVSWLHDTRTQQECEAGRCFGFFLPQLIWQRLAASHLLNFFLVHWRFLRQWMNV